MSLAEACLLAAELENFNPRIVAVVGPFSGHIIAVTPSGRREFTSAAEVRHYIDN